VPGDDLDRYPETLDQTGIIGAVLRPVRGFRVRLLQHRSAKALRGLHAAQHRSVQGSGDPLLGVHRLDRIGDRERRHHGVGAGPHRPHDRVHQLDRNQRAGRVVYQDYLGLAGQRGQAEPYRLLPGGATGDHRHRRPQLVLGQQRADLGYRLGWRDHDDQLDRW
jgi:hypothetical protein